jgi:hypothetical protein
MIVENAAAQHIPATRVFDAGIDGLIINLANGSTPEVVTAAGEALRPLLAR